MVSSKQFFAGVRKLFLRAQLCVACAELVAIDTNLKAVTSSHDGMLAAGQYVEAHQVRMRNFDLLDMQDQAAMRVVELRRKLKALA